MKKIILSIIFIAPVVGFAQSGTILPNSIQLPNVSTLGTCTTEKKGQLVLLTTDNQTYYCNGTAWVTLLTVATDSPWLVNGNHINNGNPGNVGIGIATPTRELVISNGGAPDILIQQGPFTGTTSTDGFLLGTNFVLDGEIWNFENAGIRFGTNNLERMKILSNGNVGIGISSPAERLEVVGNIKVNGEINRTGTGNANLVPIAFGNVSASGGTLGGTGNFTVTKFVGTPGIYDIVISGETSLSTSNYFFSAVSQSANPQFTTAFPLGGAFRVKIFDENGGGEDGIFSFFVYKL